MNDSSDIAGALAFEDRQRVFGGCARVHDDGLTKLARKTDEPRKDFALHVARRMVVMIVEADLADGGDLRSRAEASELIVNGVGPRGRVMGVNADTGANPRGIPMGERYRVARGAEVPADAYDHEADDTGLARAIHHGVGALREVGGVEVAVRVG